MIAWPPAKPLGSFSFVVGLRLAIDLRVSDALHDRLLELLGERPSIVLDLWAAADPLYRELIECGWIARVHSNSGRIITHEG